MEIKSHKKYSKHPWYYSMRKGENSGHMKKVGLDMGTKECCRNANIHDKNSK